MTAVNDELLDRDPVGTADFIYGHSRKGRDVVVVSCEVFDADGTGFSTFEDQMKSHETTENARLRLLGFGPCVTFKVFVAGTLPDAWSMRDMWIKKNNIQFVSDAESMKEERIATGRKRLAVKDENYDLS